MEETTTKSTYNETFSNITVGINEEVQNGFLNWEDYLTVINLNNHSLNSLNENVVFPPNIKELNLSHNKLTYVPNAVLKLNKLKVLDISFNHINYFNDVPEFCHTIETLNLSNNLLREPPYWIWSEMPICLSKLNLNNNFHMNLSTIDGLVSQFRSLITNLNIYNCHISKYKTVFYSFKALKLLEIGASELSGFSNSFEDIPFNGLDKCYDLEELNASHTNVYNVKANISMYKNLRILNLSHNNIYGLPDEFCDLESLEECILSHNNIIYLPEKIEKLKRLKKLAVDSNELCMLPNALTDLSDLTTLDLYNNKLYEITVEIKKFAEIDLAQNYFDEPCEGGYLEKRERLRFRRDKRFNGRKADAIYSDHEDRYSPTKSDCSSDDKELETIDYKGDLDEDWDSDAYWEPSENLDPYTPPPSPWLCFVKKRIAEGYFCPIDMHVVSISDQVEYEKLCNPPVIYESEATSVLDLQEQKLRLNLEQMPGHIDEY